jgi:hypothetical protein
MSKITQHHKGQYLAVGTVVLCMLWALSLCGCSDEHRKDEDRKRASGQCEMEALRQFPYADAQGLTNYNGYRYACMRAKGYDGI